MLTNRYDQDVLIPGSCYSEAPIQGDGRCPGICIFNMLPQVPVQGLRFRC